MLRRNFSFATTGKNVEFQLLYMQFIIICCHPTLYLGCLTRRTTPALLKKFNFALELNSFFFRVFGAYLFISYCYMMLQHSLVKYILHLVLFNFLQVTYVRVLFIHRGLCEDTDCRGLSKDTDGRSLCQDTETGKDFMLLIRSAISTENDDQWITLHKITLSSCDSGQHNTGQL